MEKDQLEHYQKGNGRNFFANLSNSILELCPPSEEEQRATSRQIWKRIFQGGSKDQLVFQFLFVINIPYLGASLKRLFFIFNRQIKKGPNWASNIFGKSRRQESNLYLTLRRHTFYPLNYGEKMKGPIMVTFINSGK